MTLIPPDPSSLDPDEPDDLTDDDLAVDAVVDGIATAEQQARVDASASLRSRVEELSSLRAVLAQPVEPLPPDAAAEMRRVALQSALPHGSGDHDVDRPTEGPPLARSTSRTPWLVAAAILLVLALGAVTLPRLTTDRSDTASSSASSSAADSSTTVPARGGSSDAAPTSPESAASAGAMARSQADQKSFADSSLLSLGEVPTIAELVERAVAELAPPGGATDRPGSGSVQPGADVLACLALVVPDAGAELIAQATVDGIEHLVIVTTGVGGEPGTRSIVVVRLPDCAVVEQSSR